MPQEPEAPPPSVRLTPRALGDLEEIWLQTAANWSPAQADRYITGLNATFDLLRTVPELARERTEISPLVRLHRHRSHLVVYRTAPSMVLIIRVPHIKAHWQAALDDRPD